MSSTKMKPLAWGRFNLWWCQQSYFQKALRLHGQFRTEKPNEKFLINFVVLWFYSCSLHTSPIGPSLCENKSAFFYVLVWEEGLAREGSLVKMLNHNFGPGTTRTPRRPWPLPPWSWPWCPIKNFPHRLYGFSQWKRLFSKWKWSCPL